MEPIARRFGRIAAEDNHQMEIIADCLELQQAFFEQACLDLGFDPHAPHSPESARQAQELYRARWQEYTDAVEEDRRKVKEEHEVAAAAWRAAYERWRTASPYDKDYREVCALEKAASERHEKAADAFERLFYSA